MTFFGLPASQVLNAASGVALALVGWYVASVRRGDRANLGFGLFAGGFGLGAGPIGRLDLVLPLSTPGLVAVGLVEVFLYMVALGGLFLLVTIYPTPLSRDERPLLRRMGALFVLVGMALVAWHLLVSLIDADETARGLVGWAGLHVLSAGMWSGCALLALRFPTLPRDQAAGAAIVSAALMIWPGMQAFGSGTIAFSALVGGDLFRSARLLLFLALAILLTVLWLRNTRVPDRSRIARNLAIFCLIPPLLGVATSILAIPSSPGAARVLMILLIGYAILRHQLLGIDVKVRWGISKTTLAAVFIAVFFVASETAQEFFGETLGSSYVGILAAGLLVFAIAPLSRFADRVAERAVPVAATDVRPSSAESAYRGAVRVALRDGVLTQEEERALLRLAEHAGISATRALAIHEEMEREVPQG